MRILVASLMMAGASLLPTAAHAQSYFMRQHLSVSSTGPATPIYDGTWKSETASASACSSSGTDMVKTVTSTVSCTGSSCDPATKPSSTATASCKAVCDGAVQTKRNGKVATSGGKSTQEVFLGHLGTVGWSPDKAVTCIGMAENKKQRLFGCTVSRISGAANAWMGDFSIPAGATETNANLDYVACRYQ